MKEKGITLVSLVVTIVVLIILAGVSIGVLKSDKSVIKEAKTTKQSAEMASLEEQVEAAIITAEQKHRNPTLNDVCEEIEKIENVTVNRTTGEVSSSAGYTITGKLDKYLRK